MRKRPACRESDAARAKLAPAVSTPRLDCRVRTLSDAAHDSAESFHLANWAFVTTLSLVLPSGRALSAVKCSRAILEFQGEGDLEVYVLRFLGLSLRFGRVGFRGGNLTGLRRKVGNVVVELM